MTLRRTACILAIVTSGVSALPAAAVACGVWHLEDEERGRTVSFYVASMDINARADAAQVEKKKTFGWFRHLEPKHCQRGETKLTIRDGQFLSGKTVVARLEGHNLEVAKRAFEISVKYVGKSRDLDAIETVPRWEVKVSSDGKPVAHGKAMSFSGCSPSDVDEREAEIRERVACYLTLAARSR